ncbi:hypothetical protein ACR79R_20085 [Sphingobacterium spiritivorum]|uniref:hypothetical protein n=1 Tax=Sphingobacterium spiritivorum TaxID=258 RepID=UPI003DA62813
MNKTQITFNGEVLHLLFGSWVMGQLIKEGYNLQSLSDQIQGNPFDFIPFLAYLGAVNATEDKDRDAFNRNSFYDWMDESGGVNSEEVMKVINCFTNSLGTDVPKKKETKAKSTTQVK